MKKFIAQLITKSGLTKTQIIKEINKQKGCEGAIERTMIHRWEKDIKSDTEKNISNKKQKSIICWCIYFQLEFEEVYYFLKLLDYRNPKQINKIIKDIEEQKKNKIYYFNDHESLLTLEFSKLITENNLEDKTTIIIEDNLTTEHLSFENPILDIKDDFYIRSIIIDGKTIGGSNATLEDIASNGMKFILSNDDIELVLSEPHYRKFNFYLENIPSKQNLHELCLYNEIDKILAYIKQNIDDKNCPLGILYKCLNKKISLSLKRNIYEALKVISLYIEYNKCSNYVLNNFLDFLKVQLINTTDILSQVYIIESLGYFHIYKKANHKIWEIASVFFKKEFIHPHAVWAFLVTLNLNKKDLYFKEDRKLIEKLKDIVKANSLKDEHYLELLNSLRAEFKIIF